MKRFIDWLGKLKGGYALPKHMRYRLHNDWPWGLQWIPRELNAFGPRSGEEYCEDRKEDKDGE